ncbi:MFS transporter [Streptomyces sp. NPDC058249]|uniref:MFS transporter n=1 Tax=Streptomyces sp. NPDC058249 TaxID=3346403 RepID=UPI0036E3A93E
MPETRNSSGAHDLVALLAVSLAMFCVQLDFFALNPALPRVAQSLDVPTVSLQWAISGYVLAAGALMLAAGRLGDLLGHRRMLMAGVGIFGLSSLLCAISTSAPELVAFRVLQGAGAAVIMPVGIALLTSVLPQERRGHSIGLAFAVAGIGTAVGPFVGGVLTQWAGWRWVFLVNVPIAAAAAIMAARIPVLARRGSAGIDWSGLVLATSAIAILSVAVDRSSAWGWASLRTLGLLVAGCAMLGVFTAVEARVKHPLVSLDLFGNRQYVIITLTGTVANTASLVYIFVSTLYLQQNRGLSPLLTGTVFLAPAAATAAAGPLASRLIRHHPPLRIMTAATAASGLTVLALSTTPAVPLYILLLGIAGGTLGLATRLTVIASQAAIRPERAGEGSGGTLTAMTTLGGIGMALASSTLPRHGTPTTSELALPLTLVVAACLLTACALIATGSARKTPIKTDPHPIEPQ